MPSAIEPATETLKPMTTEKQPPTQRQDSSAYEPASPRHRAVWRVERGFTIIEVMIASLVLVVGALALVGLVDAANGATASNKKREAGTNLAREVIENAGTVAHDDVTPSRILPALQSRPGLADSSGAAGYTIARRDTTFTVAVDVCNLDDPHDGLGSHATGSDGVPFCPDSGAGGAADNKPGDYRRAKTTVTWSSEGVTKTVKQSSFVMPPTGSDLPAVTTLIPSPSSPITSPSVENVDFTATTSSIPTGVSWSQDGTETGEASGSGLNWNFTWPIGTVAGGLVDGDYVIGARGRTGGGSYGPAHAITMKLNRSTPAAPRNFVAGRNGSTVDSEWLANRERDIVGYRVYRQQTAPTSGSAQQVNCGTVAVPVYITTSTTCTDAQPLVASSNISFVSATDNTSTGTAISVNRPAGVVANDVMIATVAATIGDPVFTAPAGWTLIQDVRSSGGAQGLRLSSYYRVVPSGAEPSTYSWQMGATGRLSTASITAWRGVDTAAPINVSAQQTGGNTNGATETAPSVTTTAANAMLIRAYGHRGTGGAMTLTTPTGTTRRAGTTNTSSTSSVEAQFSVARPTAGVTGTATSTCSPSCQQWSAHTIALRPAVTLGSDYWVRAVDLDPAGAYREGPSSNVVAAYAANTPPTAPSGLTASAAADGSNVVNWTTQGTDPDAGDNVAFYRVYRDGARYDRTDVGTATTYTDPRPGTGAHTYHLKAVDTRLAESPASSTVTAIQP